MIKSALNSVIPVGKNVIFATCNALKEIDKRLIDHGDRVAYIACHIAEQSSFCYDKSALLLLSLFHDIGAYKTEEINRMLEFETHNVNSHSIYGHLFIKHFTPLSDFADAILYHHSPWEIIEKSNCSYENKQLAALIFLADRVDICIASGGCNMSDILNNKNKLFKDEYVTALAKCLENGLEKDLTDGLYLKYNHDAINRLDMSAIDCLNYLKMITYSIDFRSEYTVTHTINTVTVAMSIAKHYNLGKDDTECVYLGSLLHDVGKIAIPLEILEYPGKLSDEKMAIMREHVNETNKILNGLVPEKVRLIAVRHHEKLDGSGYPLGLSGDVLDMNQRIVAVADIVSALLGRRSYKEPFDKDKAISILRNMQKSQLDSGICDYICTYYDDIIKNLSEYNNEVIIKYKSISSEYDELLLKYKLT